MVAESRSSPSIWWGLSLAVGTAALLARLLSSVTTGGLFVVDQYDAAVYFGSAVGLVHGRLPYRDFLLLHPPGSTLVLAPFAALGLVVGDSVAWAVARVAMMALGAVTAVLVVRLLRPLGPLPALLGGLCYAVFLPAVSIEVTTRLEPIAAACLLGALILVQVDDPGATLRSRSVVAAGALLGFAATVKIWGAVPLLVVLVWLGVVTSLGLAVRFAAGAAVAGVVVCLPFLIAAPAPMWRQVVSDQLYRAGGSRFQLLRRLADITGVGAMRDRLGEALLPVVVAVLVLIAGAAILALRRRPARPAVVLLVALVVLQLSTPSWFPHYAGVSAGVLAVTIGAAASVVLDALGSAVWRTVVVGLGLLGLTAAAVQLSFVEFGERFPGRKLAVTVAPLPGCVTADDPGALLGMDVLGRNLRRGCPLVLDLGGHSYDYRPRLPRNRDPRWQRFFLDYMSSGEATMKSRYHTGFGLSRATAREFRRWPVIVEVDGFELRRPPR